jgi:hypothetical protein
MLTLFGASGGRHDAVRDVATANHRPPGKRHCGRGWDVATSRLCDERGKELGWLRELVDLGLDFRAQLAVADELVCDDAAESGFATRSDWSAGAVAASP